MNTTPSLEKTVIVTGPQGCGKTMASAKLLGHFGCSRVQDDWTPRKPLVAGALHLTNDDLRAFEPPTGVRVVPFYMLRQQGVVARG